MVAVPIWNECPLYNVESIPAHLRASLTLVTKNCFVRYSSVSHMKSGPLLWGLRERYCNIAAIGQRPFPTMIVTPLQNWSVFDEGILTVMRVGL